MRTLIVALLTGWLAGCAVAPMAGPVPRGEATVYVVGRGWHTDIGLPVNEVTGPLASLEERLSRRSLHGLRLRRARVLMEGNEGSGEMLAALLPSKSAILMTALNAPPTEAFADHDVVALRLPSSDVAASSTRLWESLEKLPMDRPFGLRTDPMSAACSTPRLRPTTGSTLAIPGPRRCCTMAVCR